MCGVHAHCHDIGGMLDGISPILQNIIKVRRDKRTDLKYSGGSQTLIYAFTVWDFFPPGEGGIAELFYAVGSVCIKNKKISGSSRRIIPSCEMARHSETYLQSV